MIAALEGWDLWIVLGIVVLLFGGSQIPKLARSIGSASREFRQGIEEGAKGDGTDSSSKPTASADQSQTAEAKKEEA